MAILDRTQAGYNKYKRIRYTESLSLIRCSSCGLLDSSLSHESNKKDERKKQKPDKQLHLKD